MYFCLPLLGYEIYVLPINHKLATNDKLTIYCAISRITLRVKGLDIKVEKFKNQHF